MKYMQCYYTGKRDALRMIGDQLTDITSKTHGSAEMLKALVETVANFCKEATVMYNEEINRMDMEEGDDK